MRDIKATAKITRHFDITWTETMHLLEEIYEDLDTEDLAYMISLRDAERLQTMGQVIQEAIEKRKETGQK